MQLEALKADGRERTRGEKGELRPAVQQRAASNHDGGGYNESKLDPRIHIPANALELQLPSLAAARFALPLSR